MGDWYKKEDFSFEIFNEIGYQPSVVASYAKPFSPTMKSSCLCGSGKKFKACCNAALREELASNAAFDAFNEGEYKEALKLCRAYFTQYTIWHKRHTQPLLTAKPDLGKRLLFVDIRALSNLVDLMMRCYTKMDRREEFGPVLERLRNCIDDIRWRQRLIYYRALIATWPNGDEAEGSLILRDIEPIEEVTDPEILEFYLNLNPAVPFEKKRNLILRIIENCETPTERLQYRTLLGIQLFQICDMQGAKEYISKAIQSFQDEREDELGLYDRDRLAASLAMLGILTDDRKYLEEARKHLQGLLNSESVTDQGRSYYHHRLGETWADEGEWQNAKEEYLLSIEHCDTDLSRIMLAKCEVLLGHLSSALNTIEGIDYHILPPAEKFDYCFALALLAGAGKNALHAAKAYELFERLEVPEPYFRELRDKTLLSLMNKTVISPEPELGLGLRWLTRINRYLKLQPAVMGLGLDANKIIEDFVKSQSAKDRE
jgi:tetratricopeptide (TPR) repeat protein